MADTLLKVDNINVYYGNIHAVKDISFEVDQGEIVTLIGANGAGKSTTLMTICGIVRATGGDVRYQGRSITDVRPDQLLVARQHHLAARLAELVDHVDDEDRGPLRVELHLFDVPVGRKDIDAHRISPDGLFRCLAAGIGGKV